MQIEKLSFLPILMLLFISTCVNATSTLVYPKNHQIISDSSFTIVWDAAPGAVSYDLQVSASSNFTGSLVVNSRSLAVDTDAIVENTLTYGSFYYWRVQSHYSNGDSAYSQVDTFGYFNATSFPGLTLWLRADGKVIKDAFNNVGGWVDETPNQVDTVSQPTQNKKPVWVQNGYCNRPMIMFNATNLQYLQAPPSFQNIGTNSMTMFCVGEGNSNTYTYFSKTISADAASTYSLVNAGGTMEFALSDAINEYTNAGITGYNFTDLETFEVVINRNTGYDTLYDDDYYLGSSGGIPGPTAFNYVSPYNFYIGAYADGTGLEPGAGAYLNGGICEIIFYTEAFNDSTRMTVSQYLMDKYAPPVNLGPDIISNNFCPDTLKTNACLYNTYNWYYNGNPLSNTSSSLVATAPGTYVVTVSDIFYRNSSDTIQVIEPNPNFTGPNNKICYGDTVVWNTGLDSSIYTFLWSNSSTKSYLNISKPGTYSVTVTGPGGCSLASAPVTFSVDSFIFKTGLGIQDSFCSGNLLSLQKGAALVSHYQWAGTPPDTASSITLTNSGTYKVTLTDAFGCLAVDSINVIIKGVGPVSNFIADTVCVGAPTQFTDRSSIPSPYNITAWIWNFGDGTGSSQEDPAHIYATAGIYTDTLTTISNTGCISTPVLHTVLVRPTVKAFFTDLLACTGDTTRFFDGSAAATGDTIISWFWNFGSGNSSHQENTKFRFASTGMDTVSLAVSTALGCYDTFSRSVTVISSSAPPDSFALLAPINNTNLINIPDTFAWQHSANAVRYVIQIATTRNFIPNTIVYTNEVYIPWDSTSKLFISENYYYWRVEAFDICGDLAVSNIDSFTKFNPSYFLGSTSNPSFWVMGDGPIIKTPQNFVKEWIDQSGNKNNVYADSTNNYVVAPTWQATSLPTLNNRPVVFFNGTDSLTGGNILNLKYSSRTAFIIGRTLGATGTYYAKTSLGPPNNRYALEWANGELAALYADAQAPPIEEAFDSLWGNYEFVNWIIDRNITNTMYLTRNSIINDSHISILGSSYNYTSPFNFLLGAFNSGQYSPTSPVAQLDGDIAEVIFFDTLLSANDYASVQRYLYIKYGGGPVYLGPDITIKYGFCDYITLNASDRYINYLWSTGSTGTVDSILVTNLPGTYSITVTDIFDQLWTDTIVINRPGIHLPGDTIFCLGDSINLNVDLGPAYHYMFSTGDTTPYLTISTPGKYWVTITDTISPANGGPCSISDTINVRVDSFRVLASLGPDTTLCRGENIGLQTGASSAATYLWSGGSNDSTLTIDSAGTYQVTVTSVNGCVANSSIYVNASGAVANVAFNINPAYCIGDTINFYDETTIKSPFKILSYEWQFGDSTTDSVASPEHYYAEPGTYNVTLTVGADSSCIKSLTETLVVNPLPGDSFTNTIGCADGYTYFRNQSIGVLADPIEHYLWNYGDGTQDDTIPNPEHIFGAIGLYPVELTVTTLTGCKQSYVDTIQEFPELKVAIGADQLCEGQTVQFHDASPGFSNVAWFWQFPDFTTASDSNPTKSFDLTGQYIIMLTVTNAIGCIASDTDSITIFNPPVASFNNPDGCVQLPYGLTDSSMFVPGDPEKLRRWNFGDSSSTSFRYQPEHQYADTGTYYVTLTVTTQNNCQDSITLPVKILGPPKAAFTYTPNYGGAPIDVSFSNHSTGAVSYLWEFGDDSTSTLADPSHTYTQDGNYIIHLIVYNQVGCSDTFTGSLKVVPASLDLAILNTNIVYDSSNGYTMCAFIINVGTRTVTNFDIVANLGGGSTIIEHVVDTLYTGDTMTYCFHAHYFTTVPANQTYICIYTENPDSGVDQNPSNNIICTALANDIRIIAPYPNPAGNQVTLGAVLPENEPMTVTLYDELGRKLGVIFNGIAQKGLNQWIVNTGMLPNAGYIFRVQYKQEVFAVKFIIVR